jgi:hypothetical protein
LFYGRSRRGRGVSRDAPGDCNTRRWGRRAITRS